MASPICLKCGQPMPADSVGLCPVCAAEQVTARSPASALRLRPPDQGDDRDRPIRHDGTHANKGDAPIWAGLLSIIAVLAIKLCGEGMFWSIVGLWVAAGIGIGLGKSRNLPRPERVGFVVGYALMLMLYAALGFVFIVVVMLIAGVIKVPRLAP